MSRPPPDDHVLQYLVDASNAPFRALLANIARLDGTNVDDLISRLGLGGRDFPSVLLAAQRLVDYVDRWTRA